MKAFQRLLITTPLVLSVLSACGQEEALPSKKMTAPDLTPSVEQEAPAENASAPTVSESHEADKTHTESSGRMEAHVHGHATLAAALDGELLTFSFEAPLMSLVGFEHAAETPEQEAALSAVKDAFFVPGNMVSVNRNAGCLPITTSSGTHFSGGHASLEVEHVYTCENPGEINRIDFLMFGDYPDLAEVEAVFLGETRQAAGELTSSGNTLEVR